MKRIAILCLALVLLLVVYCTQERANVSSLVDNYAQVTIPAPDLSGITDNGKEVLSLYRKAADEVDKIYWQQYFGDKDEFLGSLSNPSEKLYAEINYGPWDRIDGKPFLSGYGDKPAGARFYPEDMTEEEFLSWNNPDKNSPYTLITRGEDGNLETVWYHDAYAESISKIEGYLHRAADVTIKESVRNYLLKMIEGLKTDDYYESAKAWLEMEDSKMDLVIGPVEAVDDALYGTKASY
ncbi:MAG: Zn-dependent hydrolase, partial [Bacteroidales bacterium]|nr:Zn-dependent hydrolase [Bacteroidales bacterium]